MKFSSQVIAVLVIQSFCLISSAQTASQSPKLTLICNLSSVGTTVSFRADLNAGIQQVESKPAGNVSAVIVNNEFIPTKIGLYIKGASAGLAGQEFDLSNTQTLSAQSNNADGSLNNLVCQVSN